MLICSNFNLFDLTWWKLSRSSSAWNCSLRILERVFDFERTWYLVFFECQILRWITVMRLFRASSCFESKNFDLISLFNCRSFSVLGCIGRSYSLLRNINALFRRFCWLNCESTTPISRLIYFFLLSAFSWTFDARCDLWSLQPFLVLKIHLELMLLMLMRLLLNDSWSCVATGRIWNGSRTFCKHVRTSRDGITPSRTMTLVIFWRVIFVIKLCTAVVYWRWNTRSVRMNSSHSLLFDSCLARQRDHWRKWLCLLVLLVCCL